MYSVLFVAYFAGLVAPLNDFLNNLHVIYSFARKCLAIIWMVIVIVLTKS